MKKTILLMLITFASFLYGGEIASWTLDEKNVPISIAFYKLNDNNENYTIVNEHGTDGEVISIYPTSYNSTQSLFDRGISRIIDTNQSFESVFQDEFTISFWVSLSDGDQGNFLVGVHNYEGNQRVLFWLVDGQSWIQYVAGSGNGTTLKTDAFSDGPTGWHHLVMRVSHSSIDLFIDAEKKTPVSQYYDGEMTNIDMSLYNCDIDFFIGGSNLGGVQYGSMNNGVLDFVTIYDFALTDDDIDYLYFIKQYGGDAEDFETLYTTVYDIIGGNDGTASVDIENLSISGKINGAFEFNGTDEYITIPDSEIFNFGQEEDCSISLWFKTNTKSSIQYLFSKYIPQEVEGYAIYMNTSGNLVFWSIDNDDTYSATALNDYADNQWHHVVGIRFGANGYMEIYVDGDFEGGASNGDGDFITEADLKIGACGNNSGKFTGSIDEIRFFNIPLDESEVYNLYLQGF